MKSGRELPPTILVVLGITGDLSHRYLLPAVAEIAKVKQLAGSLKILGVSRRPLKVQDIYNNKEKHLAAHTQSLQMDYGIAADYQKLKKKLIEIDNEFFGHKAQIIFYFAVPPEEVSKIISMMGDAGLNSKHTKIMLEKPFGVDLATAKKLIAETAAHYSEGQVYRIDHYLAKEMAQNITVFLGSNTIFRDVWSNEYIDSIEITAAEKIGIEGRVNFYESTGALRDYQSHLLQLAALVLMEPCSDIFDFEEIPRRRLAALEQIEPLRPANAIRAQYQSYRKEVDNPASTVETFIDLHITSKDPRWKGVPIRLTTGKGLDTKLTQVTVHFKKATPQAANSLVLRVQPREGIEFDLWVKEPGYERRLKKLLMSFYYGSHFGRLPDAYEQVLVDAMRSNHSLFASSGEILAGWRILQPLIEGWQHSSSDLYSYKSSSTIDEVVAARPASKILK